MQDKWILGAVSGALAAIVGGLIGMAAEGLGLATVSFVTLLSRVVSTNPTSGSVFLGWLAHLAFGGLVGTVFVYLLYWSESRNAYIKGAFYGLALWALSLGLARISANLAPLWGNTSTGWGSYLIINLIYGISLVAFIEGLREERRTPA